MFMFIDDETGRRNKCDNLPKDRATLSVIRSLSSLSFDMMVVAQRAAEWLYGLLSTSHGKTTTKTLIYLLLITRVQVKWLLSCICMIERQEM